MSDAYLLLSSGRTLENQVGGTVGSLKKTAETSLFSNCCLERLGGKKKPAASRVERDFLHDFLLKLILVMVLQR